MSFLFINRTLRFSNLKTRTAMNARVSVCVICVEVIIYLLLYNLHDCTFNIFRYWSLQKYFLLKPKFIWSFFTHKKIPYNLRKGQVLPLSFPRSTYCGNNSVHFRGSLIWNKLPSYIKPSISICQFKNNIKIFRYIDCGCLICRT